MNKARTLLISIGSIASVSFLPSCASELGSPDDGDATATGGDVGTGGDSVGTGGDPLGSGGLGTGGTGTGSGPSTGGAGTGGDPGVTYHPGFQAFMDVLSGVRIGRPDYSCASSDCHSGGHDHSAVPLRLVEDADLYTEVTTHVSVKCGNLKAIEPGSPETSAIVKVLREGCDDNIIVGMEMPIPRMPYDCVENEFENTCVAEEHIVAIEQWIAAGAPQFPE